MPTIDILEEIKMAKRRKIAAKKRKKSQRRRATSSNKSVRFLRSAELARL